MDTGVWNVDTFDQSPEHSFDDVIIETPERAPQDDDEDVPWFAFSDDQAAEFDDLNDFLYRWPLDR